MLTKESIYDNEYLRKYIKDLEQAKKISSKSSKKVMWKCPNCGSEKEAVVQKVHSRGFRCRVCSPLLSYGELFVETLLKCNNVEYQPQYRIKECKNVYELPFDFAIFNDGELKYLCEVQGEQHYKVSNTSLWDTDLVQKNDEIKRNFCKRNNIKLVEIDARETSYDYLMNSIENSDMSYLLKGIDLIDFKSRALTTIRDIDVNKVINLHKRGVSFLQIEEELGITDNIVIGILKRTGHYTPRAGKKNNAKSVVCLNNNMLFYRMDKATQFVGLKNQSNLTKVCKKERKHFGKVNNEPGRWMYYGDYINAYGYEGLSCYIGK